MLTLSLIVGFLVNKIHEVSTSRIQICDLYQEFCWTEMRKKETGHEEGYQKDSGHELKRFDRRPCPTKSLISLRLCLAP
jgi:hypothetical protein